MSYPKELVKMTLLTWKRVVRDLKEKNYVPYKIVWQTAGERATDYVLLVRVTGYSIFYLSYSSA
jgi:hypothetical protein